MSKGCVVSTQGAALQDNLTPEICKIRKILSTVCTDGKCSSHTVTLAGNNVWSILKHFQD